MTSYGRSFLLRIVIAASSALVFAFAVPSPGAAQSDPMLAQQ
jgi:hypothetical protein